MWGLLGFQITNSSMMSILLKNICLHIIISIETLLGRIVSGSDGVNIFSPNFISILPFRRIASIVLLLVPEGPSLIVFWASPLLPFWFKIKILVASKECQLWVKYISSEVRFHSNTN